MRRPARPIVTVTAIVSTPNSQVGRSYTQYKFMVAAYNSSLQAQGEQLATCVGKLQTPLASRLERFLERTLHHRCGLL
jgi:hypothetical protein